MSGKGVAMRSSLTNSNRTLAMVMALAPFAAASALAQHAPRPTARPRAQVCINGKCIEDSTRVVVIDLMDRLDSLQRVYLGTPISPDDRERMATEMSDMVSRLAGIERGTVELSLQRAAEAQREAMSEGQHDAGQYSVAMDIPSDVAPKGWIGVTFAGAPITDVRGGAFYVRYLTYPEVVSVDADSPAEHAGILRGDLLLAFNGQDVTRKAISMTGLLQPNRRVVVRLERDGEARDYPVVVGKAPRTFTLRVNGFAPSAPAAPTESVALAAPRVAVVEGMMAPAPAAPPLSFYRFDPDMAALGGAMMNTVSADLGRAFGVDKGVLVLKAPRGTPAADAGLREGDVIVKAAGVAVASVGELRRTLERHAGDASVELQIVRDRKTRTVRISND